MLYLFVSEDEEYTREEVRPEELKAAARGELKIYQIEYTGFGTQKIEVNAYDATGDHFDNDVQKRYS